MGKRQIAAMQTRLKVIVAAKRLIEKNGFKNVTIDDITKEAKVAKTPQISRGVFVVFHKEPAQASNKPRVAMPMTTSRIIK